MFIDNHDYPLDQSSFFINTTPTADSKYRDSATALVSMAPKKLSVQLCQVCSSQPSKYRCSACLVRYCSVPCYKEHKVTCWTTTSQPQPPAPEPAPLLREEDTLLEPAPEPELETQPATQPQDESNTSPSPHPQLQTTQTTTQAPLKPLTSLLWPPEPDSSIFTDPLKREDPKPLRREELLQIATSPPLRSLLSSTTLPQILRLLDDLPPSARHSMLSRLLGLDTSTLSQPAGTSRSFLTGRESPPPLGELLDTLAQSHGQAYRREGNADRDVELGWWLRGSGGEKVWIGEEEKKVMRLFAGSVCTAIDGSGEVAWGQGGLEWEV
ncbi:hypothetical protein IAR55_002679 [Kwoniella newhampshirensis]|uniref:HIT-type domain-containing protein n=1 Tax=Kwoniella newhampshirensis TaxID=1651941 RepID=A0AAW0YZW2_9TREE